MRKSKAVLKNGYPLVEEVCKQYDSFFFYYPFGILLLLFEIFSVLVFVGLNVYHILEQPVQV
jgi:hypothetical protein